MIELIHVDYKRWLARSFQDNIHVLGSLTEVATALKHRGIVKAEVLAAIESLLKNGHNVAEFGVNNMFTFSTKRVESDLFRN